MEYNKFIEVDGKRYMYHHDALTQGYVRANVAETDPKEYSGRYGNGFYTLLHNCSSTRYCIKRYWIQEN